MRDAEARAAEREVMSQLADELPPGNPIRSAVVGHLSWRRSLADAWKHRRFGAATPFLGPALIASVAYMDPGNFATNIQGGASAGYRLLWVVLLANLVAMLFQALSAKLGIVTGSNLAELSRAHFSPPIVYAMWIAAEVGAMATDLAEFLGASIALKLLLHLSLLASTLVTGIVTYAALLLERRRFRLMEAFIAALIGVIGISYLLETLLARPDWAQIAYHSVVPWLGGSDSVILAAGIVGATVMPHALYLHGSLTQARRVPGSTYELARQIHSSNLDIGAALGLAGLINLAMMYMAAAVFHDGAHNGVADIETAYWTLGPLLGHAAASIFLISLLASGLSSSIVGTMAGQVVMQGFVGWRTPLWLRRIVTMAPAVAIAALGVNATETLVISQVVLSLVLPVPMLTLIAFTSRPSIMGRMTNNRAVAVMAAAAAIAILALNVLLLLQTCGTPLTIHASI
jgi:manganese transport protein